MVKLVRCRAGQEADVPFMADNKRAMMYHKGSLTRILKAFAKKSFRVQVVSEGFRKIRLADQLDYLGSPGQLCWHRQVHLLVDEICWVVGNTWIPMSSLKGAARQLLYLKNRSLGDTLFRDPHLQRSEFIFSADGLTRSSLFLFYQQPLVVRESFIC